MVTILMSAKVASLVSLKIKVFFNKGYNLMSSSTKMYHVTQIILFLWSCDNSLETLEIL